MSKPSDPRILVLCGNAINCDEETAYAIKEAGGKPKRVLTRSLFTGKESLDEFDGAVMPGGFSYADDVAAGKLLAMNIKNHLTGQIHKFVKDGKLILGICNGFQVLTYFGFDDEGIDYGLVDPKITLMTNESGRFRNDWVNLEIDPNSKCIITKDIDNIKLPIRHKQGRIYAASETIKALQKNGQVALRYVGPNGEKDPGWPYNPNGSIDDIAGYCDPTGQVLGLMPHPEAAIREAHHPLWRRYRATGSKYAVENAEKAMKMLKNFVDYLRT